MEMREDPNKDYIAVKTSAPFALAPTVSNESNKVPIPGYPPNIPPIPSIDSLSDMPDMPNMPLTPGLNGMNPELDFAKSVQIKAIIYSEGEDNIAILSDGQNDIAVGVGQETEWGTIDAINMDSVVIGQETISAQIAT